MTTIRIGTRRSQLAMWQANYVRGALCNVHPDLDVEIVGITTQGDRTLDVPLATEGGKGLFLKELEQALLTGDIDLAVHSMKDVTVSLPPGLHIPVICLREDPHDALVSNQFANLSELPEGAVVGTCSVRRQCMLKHRFPTLRVDDLRGNVNSRLSKLDNGDVRKRSTHGPECSARIPIRESGVGGQAPGTTNRHRDVHGTERVLLSIAAHSRPVCTAV